MEIRSGLSRTEALWNVQIEKVLHLEDIEKNMNSMDRRFKEEFPKPRTGLSRRLYNPVVDWYWYCLLKPPFLKVLAVVTGTLSLMVVWSEVTFFNRKPVLSIFANVLNLAKLNYDFFTVELFSMATLCYLTYCAYSTVFAIKFFNLYYLAAHHQTNEYSLIFSGMMLCRLTPPMCLNFLGLVHMDSHIIKERIMETYYTQVMGHMDVIAIISDGFNIYFPMVMLAFCLATWFSLGTRTLNALGFQQFMENETMATELVQEGRSLIGRERRRKQRAEEALSRRRSNREQEEARSTSINLNKTRPGRTSTSSQPDDGLLQDADLFSYAATSAQPMDFSRSLAQEINERFGLSTQVEIEFKGLSTNASDDENYDDTRIGNFSKPKGIFDDI